MQNVLELFSIKGKVALVTGAASGIGQAIAVALAEAGADIAGTYNTTPPDQTKGLIEGVGQKYFAIKANLKNPEDADKVVDEVIKHYGHLDILINCAGVTGTTGTADFDNAIYTNCMDINVNSIVHLSVAAGKQFIKQGKGGKIINISSIAGVVSTGASVIPYVTSKHAVVGITRSMALDLAPHGINVNAIAPGVIATKMIAGYEDLLEAQMKATVPLGRYGKPEDFKGVSILLASPAGDFITGQVYLVDGGYCAM